MSSSTSPVPSGKIISCQVPLTNLPQLSDERNRLLSLFEDYFSAGVVTSKVGGALQDIANSYHFADDDDDDDDDDEDNEAIQDNDNDGEKAHKHVGITDHAGAQENYGHYLMFGELIDSLVSDFVEKVDLRKIYAEDKNVAAPSSTSGNDNGDAAEAGNKESEKLLREGLLAEIAEMCYVLVDDVDAAAMFISIPYVAAGLSFEKFEVLVLETAEMMNTEFVQEESDEQDEENKE